MEKLISLLLTMVLIFALFAGCGSSSEDTAEETGETEESGEMEEAEETEEAAENDTSATGGLSLPLSEETVTLTAFRQYSGGSDYPEDVNDIAAWAAIEENTNVVIEWTTYSDTTSETFNLFIASGDYTDMIFAGIDTYAGGIDEAISEEIYMDGRDYLDLMPNFSVILEASEDITRLCTTDSGNIFFNSVQNSSQPCYVGPMVRSDWVSDLGLDLPVTYDDWYEMLTAMQTELGVDSPLVLSADGYSDMSGGLTSGFGTTGGFYAENGTTVRYGFIDDGMRDYLELISSWYAEGLINRDFFTLTWADMEDLYTSGITGAFDTAVYTFRATYPEETEDPDDDLVAVPFPSQTEEEQGSLHFRNVNEICGRNCIFISTAAVDRGVDELCAQYIDYRYSEEGSNLLNYGVEGVSWEYDENGEPAFTDVIMNDETRLPSQAMNYYTDQTWGSLYAWERENQLYSDDILSAYDVWNGSATGDWVMPSGITMTSEESEAYSAIYSDIETYVDTMILSFITGGASLDDWDSFVDTIYEMGIEECISYQQAALDRYLER